MKTLNPGEAIYSFSYTAKGIYLSTYSGLHFWDKHYFLSSAASEYAAFSFTCDYAITYHGTTYTIRDGLTKVTQLVNPGVLVQATGSWLIFRHNENIIAMNLDGRTISSGDAKSGFVAERHKLEVVIDGETYLWDLDAQSLTKIKPRMYCIYGWTPSGNIIAMDRTIRHKTTGDVLLTIPHYLQPTQLHSGKVIRQFSRTLDIYDFNEWLNLCLVEDLPTDINHNCPPLILADFLEERGSGLGPYSLVEDAQRIRNFMEKYDAE
jgi:hypothetical protein